MVFGDVQGKHILQAFLSAVLDLPDEKYDEIGIIDPHLKVDVTDEKRGAPILFDP